MKEVDRVWLEELKRCNGICGREHESLLNVVP